MYSIGINWFNLHHLGLKQGFQVRLEEKVIRFFSSKAIEFKVEMVKTKSCKQPVNLCGD